MTLERLRRFSELLREQAGGDLDRDQRRELLELLAEYNVAAQRDLEESFGLDHSGSEAMREALPSKG